MDDEVDRAPQLFSFRKHRIDRGAGGDVAMAEHMGAQFMGEWSDTLFQRVALKRERQFGPRRVGGFGDAPGDRAIVRHA